ncbi:hypothetical protein [Pseudomonas panipatensis]|uniref:DUF7740 domain-containing protein n=1 Tax=Pseudomonas panipatensis TaxID=428992 RepID=A0A1G8MMF0_9PSED|nr:hypothetical protein [Pseudomonas panipatensis]SDI69093.1 hypothetical protein SAMN05216272_11621 [Pseudomonas panipatensis]SMP77523.1 hypothetical protein SAMN06295951_11721 [Pseudomonas panipatensis]
MLSPLSKPSYRELNLQDALLALLLTVRLHGTDAAVRATAKRCAKQLPRSKRDLMYRVIDSTEPLKLVRYLGENLD